MEVTNEELEQRSGDNFLPPAPDDVPEAAPASVSKRFGYFAVIAAVAIQLTLGVAYIWSIFQSGIAENLFGGNQTQAALTFSILLAMLTIGSIIGGKIAVKFGSTRMVVFSGGLLLSLGFFLASFVSYRFGWVLWLTYGGLGGLGMGFTYSTTIACAQKWFPHRKGLVTGIIVSAIGFGGVILTPLIETMISTFGNYYRGGELTTIRVLSGIFLVVCTVGSFFLKVPPKGYMADVAVKTKPKPEVSQVSYNVPQMLKMPQFYLVTFTLLLAVIVGQMMLAFARPIAVMGDLPAVMIGVMILAITNSAGRLFWGTISDKIGRYNTVIILLAGCMVLALLVGIFIGNVGVYVLMGLIGFFFGGILGTYPAFTADIFGPKNLATNYGFVLLGFGVGAILSSIIAGAFVNIAQEYNDATRIIPAFIIAAAGAAVGLALIIILKVMQKRKKMWQSTKPAKANAGTKK